MAGRVDQGAVIWPVHPRLVSLWLLSGTTENQTLSVAVANQSTSTPNEEWPFQQRRKRKGVLA